MASSSPSSRLQLTKNAVAFAFVSDGFPIMYSGVEHGASGGKS
jgi:hypothetical protein